MNNTKKLAKEMAFEEFFSTENGFSEEFLHECELEYERAKLITLLAKERMKNKICNQTISSLTEQLNYYKNKYLQLIKKK